MTEILPWYCHICKSEFTIEMGMGGICDVCEEPTCSEHLKVSKENKTTKHICIKCQGKSPSQNEE